MKPEAQGQNVKRDFERQVIPHLDSAYRLAFYMVKSGHAAEDVVQNAYLKAFQGWRRFDGRYPRAWLLTIVRRCAFDWLMREKQQTGLSLDDEDTDVNALSALKIDETQEADLIRSQSAMALRAAMNRLSPAFAEVVVLVDMESMSYKTVAQILDIPIGTVMSRLMRARQHLKRSLLSEGPYAV